MPSPKTKAADAGYELRQATIQEQAAAAHAERYANEPIMREAMASYWASRRFEAKLGADAQRALLATGGNTRDAFAMLMAEAGL